MRDRIVRLALGIGVLGSLVAGSGAALRAQNIVQVAPPPPETRLETTLETHNVLIEQDVYRLGDGTTAAFGLTIDAMVVNVPPSGHVRGVRVLLRDASSASHTQASYLDFEELDGLSSALAQMVTIAGQWTGPGDERSSELHYASFAGFSIEIHQDGRGEKGTVSSGTLDPVHRPIALADVTAIKNAIDQAIELLKQK